MHCADLGRKEELRELNSRPWVGGLVDKMVDWKFSVCDLVRKINLNKEKKNRFFCKKREGRLRNPEWF